MTESSLNAAIRQFETIEANLAKAERVLDTIFNAIPSKVFFGNNDSYDQDCRDFYELYATLPKIDGWKPEVHLMDLNEIAQSRFDAQEVDEIHLMVSVESSIEEPGRQLKEYRHRFDRKRRELVRHALLQLIQEFGNTLDETKAEISPDARPSDRAPPEKVAKLKDHVAEIAMLLGTSFKRPARWSDLQRHLSFGLVGDLHDIDVHDWPAASAGLRASMYGERDPLPTDVEDIASIVEARPRGPVAVQLKWGVLGDDDFERLIFMLIAAERGYENPEWLMRTNAPDRGRDLSVYRVIHDALGGTIRKRVIIQCRHWQSKSVGLSEVSLLREQMKLWEPPRVDVNVIATSGRFTADAVSAIEKHNLSDSGLRIEMWPDSHLERLLSSRPPVIAEFGLR